MTAGHPGAVPAVPVPVSQANQGFKSLNSIFDAQIFFLCLFCALD